MEYEDEMEQFDYGLEYSDSEDSVVETDINLENQYYLSKSLKNKHTEQALEAFQKVLDLQGDVKGPWGFKALKQMVKIHYWLKNYEIMMERYEELLTYLKFAVTKNHAEKSLNAILDLTSGLQNALFLKRIYETTLTSLHENRNERLWFKINLKLGQIYLANAEFYKVTSLIKQLKQLVNPEQEQEKTKFMDNQMLEIYALEMLMFTEMKNYNDVQKIYNNCTKFRSVIAHPLTISVIKECGGKMYLKAGEYDKAYTDFFEAFKNFDEACSSRKYICLKYLLLTSMLMKSEIDPFDSQEVKPYKNNQELKSMIDLITAYQSNNMKQFEAVFQTNKSSFIEDEFIAEHVVNLLQDIRCAILLSLIKPYKKIKLSFVSLELGIKQDEAEELIVNCIIEGTIDGKIDQVQNVLVMSEHKDERLHAAMYGLAFSLQKIINNPLITEF